MRLQRAGLIALLVLASAGVSACAQLAEPVGSSASAASPSATDPDVVSESSTPQPEPSLSWMTSDSCSRPYGEPPAHPTEQELRSFLATGPWSEAGDGAWASTMRDYGLMCDNLLEYGCVLPNGLELGQVYAYADARHSGTGDLLHIGVSAERDAEEFVRWTATVLAACDLETPMPVNPDGRVGDGSTWSTALHALELPRFAEQQVCLTFDRIEPDGVTRETVTYSCHAATGAVRVYLAVEAGPDNPVTVEALSTLFSELAVAAFDLQDAP